MLLILFSLTALAEDLSYPEALQQALDRNASVLGGQLSADGARGALLASKGIFDPELSGWLGYSANRSEGTREFGEVLSSFNSLNADAEISQYLQTGTSLSLGLTTSQSRFRYELRDTGLVVESDEPQWSTDLSLGLTQNLLEGFSRRYNLQGVRAAEQAVETASLSVLATRQQVLADTASAYWGLVLSQRLVTIAEQGLAVAEEERRIVLARVQAGSLAPIERTRVEAAVVQARSSQLQARSAAAAASEGLQVLLGDSPDGQLRAISEPAEPSAIELDDDAIAVEALRSNLDLQQLRLSEEGADLDLRDAQHARLPSLSLVGSAALKGYETSLSGSFAEVFGGELLDWSLGGQVGAPLGNRAARGSVAQREAALGQARISREAAERGLLQGVRAQVRAVEQAAVTVELARANLDLAEQTLAAERVLQEAGRALQKDVLESMRAVDSARVAVEQARVDHAMAVVELMRLRGAL